MQEDSFLEISDEFINFANGLAEDWAEPVISAALLYAAARYNAFIFHEADGDEKNIEKAMKYYTDQYQQMLKENLLKMKK